MELERYTKNLKLDGEKVMSYNTHVATVDYSQKKVFIHGWWSATTAKHINYVAKKLGYQTEVNNNFSN